MLLAWTTVGIALNGGTEPEDSVGREDEGRGGMAVS